MFTRSTCAFCTGRTVTNTRKRGGRSVTEALVILEGKAEFAPAEFAEFWADWKQNLSGPSSREYPSSVDIYYDSEAEVAPGVVFKEVSLLAPNVRWEEEERPLALRFLSGQCTATVLLEQIEHVSVQARWLDLSGSGMSKLCWDVDLAKTDGYVIKAHLVEVIRCNRRVRERLRSWLQERLAVQAGLEVR